jgi:uncharacterized protein
MNSELIGQFATFPVVSITSIGAFLDWGFEKDLFLPSSEQTDRVQIDDQVVVFIYLDKQDRPCASMRLERFASKEIASYKPEQTVEALIYQKTDLGYKAIVDQKYLGLLYLNEVFKPLYCGDLIQAVVKKIRTDGKIDLNLRAAGHQANDDIGQEILQLLEKNDGFMAIDDKTAPEKIYELFGVSKKKYKVALGQLYKNRKIEIVDNGIRLTRPSSVTTSKAKP